MVSPNIESRAPKVYIWHGNVDVLQFLGQNRARTRIYITAGKNIMGHVSFIRDMTHSYVT